MVEADLSPTTFTSRSASDTDYDISTGDSSENENESTYTEASSDNWSSDPETESNTKSENFRIILDLVVFERLLCRSDYRKAILHALFLYNDCKELTSRQVHVYRV